MSAPDKPSGPEGERRLCPYHHVPQVKFGLERQGEGGCPYCFGALPSPPAESPAPVPQPTWIGVALAWIKNHGRHTADCYQNRAFERECDCGLWDLKQLIRLREEAAPPPAEARITNATQFEGNALDLAADALEALKPEELDARRNKILALIRNGAAWLRERPKAEAPASEPPASAEDVYGILDAGSAPTRAEPTRECQCGCPDVADLRAKLLALGEQAKRAEEERDEARARRGTSDREWLQENDRAKRLERETAALIADRDHWKITADAHVSLVLRAQDIAGSHDDIDMIVKALVAERNRLREAAQAVLDNWHSETWDENDMAASDARETLREAIAGAALATAEDAGKG